MGAPPATSAPRIPASPSLPAHSLLARLESARPAVVLALLLGLQTLVHLPELGRPPFGAHLWRQTQTLAVARNFAEVGMNPLLPRVDSRGGTSGIAGMEFPLVNYAIAIGYRMGGGRDVTARLVLLGFSLLAVAGCFLLARDLLDSVGGGAAAAALLIFSPMYFFFATTAVPEFPMLGFLCLGLWGLRRWGRSDSPRALAFGLGALTLAALIKLSAVVAAPVVLHLLVRHRYTRPGSRGRTTALVLLAAAAVAGWYVYARYLSDTYGVHDFRLSVPFPYPLAAVPGAMRRVFVQLLPEFVVSYPETVFCVVGALALAAVPARGLGALLAGYGIGVALYLGAFLPAFPIQSYYLAPLLPLLAVLGGLGFERLRHRAATSRAWGLALAALCVAVPVVGPYRSLAQHQAARYPPEMLTLEARLDRILPDRRVPVVAASDESPSIYLYFMHRNGWSITDHVEGRVLAGVLAAGAAYLVSDSRTLEARPDLAPRLRLLARHGVFNIFTLGPPAGLSALPAPGASAPDTTRPPR